MGWHFPWETKVDITGVRQMMEKGAKMLEYYSKCSPFVAVFFGDKSRVKQMHDKIIGASKYIDAGVARYGWAKEIKQLCEAVEVLNKAQTLNDQMATAGAFGQLLSACSAIVGKTPFGGDVYGQALEKFGENFQRIYKQFLPAGFTDEQYQNLWKNPQDQRGNG